MFNLYLTIIGVLGFAAAEVAKLPPLGGKFFYSDIRSGAIYGMHYIDVLVGYP